jgi:hypothetical protein
MTILYILDMFFIFICGISSGFILGSSLQRNKWKKIVIERDLVKYNSKTHRWEWNNKPH